MKYKEEQGKKRVRNLTLKIDNTIIERVPEFNFHGFTLHENLTWKCNINKISNNISQFMGLNRLKHFLPIQTKGLIYNSMVLSYINYGLLAWGFQCEKVTYLQMKVIRILTVSKYNAHIEPETT